MHNQDEQSADPRAQAIQRIVADLLGESDASDRAQIAADIANDPSLAAERQRLEATIGLVRDSMTADASPETLSPEAAARLAQAAAGGGRVLAGPGSSARAWYATPVFRAAAGFALALGAFALWQGSGSDLRMASSVETADAKRQAQESAADAPFVYEIWGEEAPARDASQQADRFDSGVAQSAPAAAAEAPKDGKALAGAEPELLNALRGLGYVERSATEGGREGQPAERKNESLHLGVDASKSPAEPPPATAGAGGAQAVPGDSVAPGAPGAGGASVAGASEGRFGGRFDESLGAPRQRLLEPPQESIERSITHSETSSGAIKGSDEFFLGRGEREAAPKDADERYRLEELKKLGYVDGNESDEALRLWWRQQPGAERRGLDDRSAPLTAEERTRAIDLLFADCRRRPSEHPRDMFYRWWGDNPFEYARTDPLSTFAVDVDTASYTLARRYLVEGILPTKQQIRTEEFVNYFKGDVPAPTEETFAVATELAPSPFNLSGDTWTMRVALRGREVSRQERKPLALTFVVDVSGSMQEQNRLELVKHALRLLAGELDARDSIAIVAFTNDARLVLPKTSARQRDRIESAIHPLAPQGGTNVQAGLRMGYEAALAGLDPEAHNRVVLLSDGVGNIGQTDAQALNREVESARERGVWLNTIGVGMGNHNDAFLEQLADKGDGLCNYIDDEREARRALVENFTGAFEPIARDVKIQVEFDPAQVERYRLLGYENRAVADADFRNDKVDAGEIGAGHQVVALYEVVRRGAGEGPLATVRVRWQPVGAAQAGSKSENAPAREAAWTVDGGRAAGSFAATSKGFRRSVLVGQLAEVLRRSIHARDDSLETLLAEARKLAPELGDPDFDEFVGMVERTIELIARDWGRYDDLARRLDQLRMQNYLKARLEDVARDLDRTRLEELDGQIRTLEQEIRVELEKQDPQIRGLGYTEGKTDDR